MQQEAHTERHGARGQGTVSRDRSPFNPVADFYAAGLASRGIVRDGCGNASGALRSRATSIFSVT
jgi:hypothetical protein